MTNVKAGGALLLQFLLLSLPGGCVLDGAETETGRSFIVPASGDGPIVDWRVDELGGQVRYLGLDSAGQIQTEVYVLPQAAGGTTLEVSSNGSYGWAEVWDDGQVLDAAVPSDPFLQQAASSLAWSLEDWAPAGTYCAGVDDAGSFVVLFARAIGCVFGDTSCTGSVWMPESLDLAKKRGCLACHSVDKKVVGPSFNDISAFYAGDTEARATLIRKVRNGGTGNWREVTGGIPMPPMSPRVSDDDIDALVDFVLALRAGPNGEPVIPTGVGPGASLSTEAGLALAEASGCLACHSMDRKVVGPSFQSIADLYASDLGAREMLIRKVRNGGTGTWGYLTGGVPMPPNSPRVSDQTIIDLVDFVLTANTR